MCVLSTLFLDYIITMTGEMFKKVARIGTRVSFEALCANIDFCGEANFGMRN